MKLTDTHRKNAIAILKRKHQEEIGLVIHNDDLYLLRTKELEEMLVDHGLWQTYFLLCAEARKNNDL